MVKYYIKITNEKPLDEDSALWFELESDEETGKADFFVLDRNEYTALVQKFKDVQHSYDVVSANFNDSVIEEVKPTIESYITSLDTVPNATKLIDSEDENNYHTYSSLTEALENIESDYNTKLSTKLNSSSIDSSLSASSTNPVQNKVVKTALDSKANSSTVTSLQSTLNSKAPSNHTHTGWTFIQFNDYCIGYYNSAIRIIVVRYYRKGYNFKQTSTIKLHSGLFKNYKPIIGGDVVLPMYFNDMGGYVDNGTGDMYVYSKITGSREINTSAMWRY